MTREEAIKYLHKLYGMADMTDEYGDMIDTEPYEQALEMAIKALEQEPCEDAVSRQAVLDMICNVDGMEGFENSNIFAKHYVNNVKALPSITPQQKVGRWINKYAEDACGERYSYWACSECGRDVGFNLANIEDVLNDYPYCHCGAKMEVSKDK